MPRISYSLVLLPETMWRRHSSLNVFAVKCIFSLHYIDPRFCSNGSTSTIYRAENGWSICPDGTGAAIVLENKFIYLATGYVTIGYPSLISITNITSVEHAQQIVREINAAFYEWSEQCSAFVEAPPAPPATVEVQESLLDAEEDLSDEAENETSAPPPADQFILPRITL